MNHFLNKKITYNGKEVTDIFQRIKVIDRMKEDSKFFFQYFILDGETPELVALKIYGSVEWWWLVLIYMDIVDPWHGWPLSNNELEEYVKKLVPDWETNLSGYSIRLNSEMYYNDQKKVINLLRPEYLDVVIKNMLNIK